MMRTTRSNVYGCEETDIMSGRNVAMGEWMDRRGKYAILFSSPAML